MGYVYLLKSQLKKWYYIGSTRNLKSRLIKHNSGQVKSTRAHKPFNLVYYEAYPNYHLARKRELELKINSQQKELLFKRLGIV